MYSTVSDPRVLERWKGKKRLTLVAAFEDSATGTRLKGFCEDISRHLSPHCRVVEHVWLLSLFRLRELQEIAAEEAAAADLVVLAVHNANNLPDEAKRWMDLWSQQKSTHPAVLLALLDYVRPEMREPMESYLQEAARRGGMEFLVESRAEPETRKPGR
jgi:hypothetical protein